MSTKTKVEKVGREVEAEEVELEEGEVEVDLHTLGQQLILREQHTITRIQEDFLGGMAGMGKMVMKANTDEMVLMAPTRS
jgi:hypothetical protein